MIKEIERARAALERGEKEKPHRAITIKLTLGADSVDDLCDALESIATEFALGRFQGPSSISGGCRSGFHMEIERRPEITPEMYQQKLKEYVAHKRQQNNRSE